MPKKVWAASTWVVLASTCGALSPAASEPVPNPEELVNYYGTIASIDAKSGEFIIMGTREDREGEDVIVKLHARPDEVDVTDIAQHSIDFSDLSKGDNVSVECRIENNEIFVDFILVYSQKDV